MTYMSRVMFAQADDVAGGGDDQPTKFRDLDEDGDEPLYNEPEEGLGPEEDGGGLGEEEESV